MWTPASAGERMTGWTVVFRGADFAAEVIRATLEASGFRAEVMTDTGRLWPGLNAEETRVFVPEDQAEGALRLMATEFPEGQPGSS